MIKSRTRSASLLAACLLLALSCVAARAQQVKLIEHKQTLDVQIDGKLFTTYHFDDNYFHSPVRPFLYPVNASDGVGITTDQQQTDPKHGYQRSIWIGHGDVNGTNHWKFAEPLARQIHLKFDWVKSDAFQEELMWTDKDGKPQLHETRTLRFHAYPDGARSIAFTLALTPAPGAGDVTFGTKGDKGLLSVRELYDLYHAPTFTSPEGTGPTACAVKMPKHKKGEPAAAEPPPVPGVHTAWCDESGQYKGSTYGVAIFDHPDNLRHPPMWHANPDARLATDMFSIDRSSKTMRQGPLTIPAGTTLTLRYDVLVHQGPATGAGLKAKYAAYSATK